MLTSQSTASNRPTVNDQWRYHVEVLRWVPKDSNMNVSDLARTLALLDVCSPGSLTKRNLGTGNLNALWLRSDVCFDAAAISDIVCMQMAYLT